VAHFDDAALGHRVSVIVVNYNTAALIRPMMDCLLASAVGCGPVQIVVLDNASRDDSLAALKALSGKIELIVNAHNVGFGRANNQCLALARGRYVLLLNTDAFVAPDTLRKTLDYMDSHPSTGVLGARLVGLGQFRITGKAADQQMRREARRTAIPAAALPARDFLPLEKRSRIETRQPARP
jgi:GT2 family glycosyltransferase